MSGAGTVLVVDDNATNVKLLRLLLQATGWEVWTAAHAEEALGLLRERRPAVILMDLQLPGMDGLELTRRLKADPSTRDCIIIALTAFAMKGDEAKARAAGCDDYVTKPVDIDALPGLLTRWVERRAGGGPT